MAGKDLKAFKAVWAATCKTMWVQVAALRHLEGFLRGNYASIPAEAVVTDLTFAPECKGRLDDATKDFLLQRVAYFIHCEVTLRVVLLSAAFESFFDVFLESYILHRPKFFAAGTRTKEGDKVYGETKRASGLAERDEAFAT